MEKTVNVYVSKPSTSSEGASTSKIKLRNQARKRKRQSSESSNDNEIILPENALETERNLHASAVKNNLDETSVRKILKRVVTNDHVLALVQLREEEESSNADDKNIQPKLTRAKVKELKKGSTCKSTAWDLEKLELTPIKHIPVKTRPEVKALIAQELPEDEDDDEYQPTQDDVPSDDEHAESCSDLDSQPRTPATPATPASPQVVKDGPFKVPQDISKARRKLEIEEEEATIALRTRSKLSLSSTSIEHIESTFIPPDDLPIQDVDNLWSEFLNECLNPTSVKTDEDDETLDETDPEYNVAADPDAAHDEDEESLSNSIIKISKKELNDLVTELFSILPEAAEEELAGDLANSVLTDTSHTSVTQYQTKQEPLSDEENVIEKPSQKLEFEESSQVTEEITDVNSTQRHGKEKENPPSEKEDVRKEKVAVPFKKRPQKPSTPRLIIDARSNNIEISIEESQATSQSSTGQVAPPSLRQTITPASETVKIQVDSVTMSQEQIMILQQQLRQHIQLAASNFMLTVVHPVHWRLAPQYKEYLVSLNNLAENNDKSVVNVCNMKPAYELITTWEKSVTVDNEENRKMIEFLSLQVDKSRRRISHNSLYAGDFHETFMKVVANSPVFLYPYLLPCMPYRPDAPKKFSYHYSEDTLIVLGMAQFWAYVESNPDMFKLYRVPVPNARRGFMATVDLVCKHMFPWMTANRMAGHIQTVRSGTDRSNPIYRYFKFNEMPKIEHSILPYNPALTLYEQPEFEMPRIWVRYLAKTSQRFRKFYHKRDTATTGRKPVGVPINTNINQDTLKNPLPIDFTKEIVSSRSKLLETPPKELPTNRIDIDIQKPTNTTQNLIAKNFYRLVETSAGAYLLPLQVVTNTTNSTLGPITTPSEVSNVIPNNLPEVRTERSTRNKEHCICCVLLRKICKQKQSLITDYFKADKSVKKCYCNDVKYPRITNRLKLLVRHCKKKSEVVFKDLERRLKGRRVSDSDIDLNSKDMAHVLSYQLKVFTQASMCKRIHVKKRVSNLLSHFDVTTGSPTKLASDLFKAYDVELVDLYLDFMSFLTPQQAESLGAFKDYFTRSCAQDLMEMIEEQVPEKYSREVIFGQLKKTLSRKMSPCEMCASLLKTMVGRAALANYTFNLFPHTRENRAPLPTELSNTTNCQNEPNITIPVFNAQHQKEVVATMPSRTQTSPNKAVYHRHMQVKDMQVKDMQVKDIQVKDMQVKDMQVKDMQVKDMQVKDIQVKDMQVKDIQVKDVQVKDMQVKDMQVKDMQHKKPVCNKNVQITNKVCDEEMDVSDVMCDERQMIVDYEADHSSSGEENDTLCVDTERLLSAATEETQIYVKPEPTINEIDPLSEVISIKTLDGSDSDNTMSIIEDNDMKQEESTDWTKEEDRTILQVLQEHLTKDERKNRSIRDLLQEKNVYGMLFDALDRSMCQIKERVLYLLTMLVVSESDT